jgi:hypothetical protein
LLDPSKPHHHHSNLITYTFYTQVTKNGHREGGAAAAGLPAFLCRGREEARRGADPATTYTLRGAYGMYVCKCVYVMKGAGRVREMRLDFLALYTHSHQPHGYI